MLVVGAGFDTLCLRLGPHHSHVQVFEVDHQPVRHAFGFVFRTPEARLVLSGDTRACAAVVDAARGADLLVHEVFVHREMPITPGVRGAETVANVASYHTTGYARFRTVCYLPTSTWPFAGL